MKTLSQSAARRPLDRGRAWTCLLINAGVCPGLGSVMARRWVSGVFQLVLAWGGAVWMVIPLLQYFSAWIRLMQEPPDGQSYLNTGLGGFAFFLAGWLWAIFTGICILRATPKEPPQVV